MTQPNRIRNPVALQKMSRIRLLRRRRRVVAADEPGSRYRYYEGRTSVGFVPRIISVHRDRPDHPGSFLGVIALRLADVFAPQVH